MKRSSKRNARANSKRRQNDRDRSATGRKPEVLLAGLKQGREHGAAMLYDPNQEYNYKSGEERYQRAIAISPQAMLQPGGLWRVPAQGDSDRGYWTAGPVKLWCHCDALPDYGRIIEIPEFETDLAIAVRDTNGNRIGLWQWTGEPDCTLLGGAGELVELGSGFPTEESSWQVDFNIPQDGITYYSISLGSQPSGGNFYFGCFKVNNLRVGELLLEVEP